MKTINASIGIICCWTALLTSAFGQANGKLQIHFMDVGQGDGAVLISPNGEVVLFDDGVKNKCDKPLAYLHRLGLTKIDYHVLSHYHADHFGCCGQVLSEFPLQKDAIDRGDVALPATTSDAFKSYIDTVGAHRKKATAGTTVILDQGSTHQVTIRVVALNGNIVQTKNENDLSLDCLVEFGGFRAEIGGDLSGYSEGGYKDIETSVAPLVGQIDVYKVHHHGSRESTNRSWLEVTNPTVGIISCGTGNTYNHPTEECLEALHDAGVKTYWTESGNGVEPEDGLDVVGGDIVVQVAHESPTYTVTHSGNQTDTFPVHSVHLNSGPHLLAALHPPPVAHPTDALLSNDNTVSATATQPHKATEKIASTSTASKPSSTSPALESEIFMPDGQLKNHLIRVFTTADIPVAEAVTLTLLPVGSNFNTTEPPWAVAKAVALARNVSWVRPATNNERKLQNLEAIPRTGTLMLFNVNPSIPTFASPWRIRVNPILTWVASTDKNENRWPQDGSTVAMGAQEIGIASGPVTVLWALALVFICVMAIGKCTEYRTRSFFGFLKEPDDYPGAPANGTHFSMWLVQLMIWTVAISAMVLAVTNMKSGNVAIPTQLLVLMGLSLTTSGIVVAKKEAGPKSAGFLFVYNEERLRPEFSIAKAQMLVWTLLTVFLFVVKSWMDCELWEVPWVLVGLMGFSQAGYVAPKLVGG